MNEDIVTVILQFVGNRRDYISSTGSYIFPINSKDSRYNIINNIPKIRNGSVNLGIFIIIADKYHISYMKIVRDEEMVYVTMICQLLLKNNNHVIK